MDYLIEIREPAIDLAIVRDVLQGLDAAAMADLVVPRAAPALGILGAAAPAAQHTVLRVSAALSIGDLLGLLEDAGLDVGEQDIRRQPSVCCGGCGG